jgi:hypothetical protein
MKMKIAMALIVVGASHVVQAEEWREPDYPLRGWYAGADLGGWRFKDQLTSISVTGFTYSPFLGYRVNRYVAVEGAYVGGDASTSVNGVDISLHANIAEGSLIGSLPLTGYAGLYARAGVAKWWSTSSISTPAFSVSADDHGANGVYGAGVYEEFDEVASRIEWTRANIQGARVNRIAVAAYWRF